MISTNPTTDQSPNEPQSSQKTATIDTISNAAVIEDENATAEQFLTLVQFIERRQQQKQNFTLNKKNSLSKLKQSKNTKAKNKSIENEIEIEIEKPVNPSFEALKKLTQLLGNQLSEGHTIYRLSKIQPHHYELFQTWQQQGWLSVIPSKNNRTEQGSVANTPIVMQLRHTSAGLTQAVFWLQRQWYAERQLAAQLLAIAQRGINSQQDNAAVSFRLGASDTTTEANAEQQQAINNAHRFALSIITGGPGTGKTYTVAKLVIQLQHAHDAAIKQQPYLPPLSIALTAPTGKAAQRMQASLMQSLNGENISLEPAKTLHRLLGIGTTGLPNYHADNPLPYDLIIVDEASMLGLELASLLVDAIKPTARLILLGDANQLAAVDAGSVLADLCQVAALQPYRTELIQSKRFDDGSTIGQLAKAIGETIHYSMAADTNPTNAYQHANRANRANRAKWQRIRPLLTKSSWQQPFELFDSEHRTIQPPIRLYPIEANTEFWQVYQTLAQPYQAFFKLMRHWYVTPPDVEAAATRQQLFLAFDKYRVLTAGHQGKVGSETLNKKIGERYIKTTNLGPPLGFFYHGLPVMITHNDYQLGLFNGDIGVCLQVEQTLWVCFPDKIINSSRLSLEGCEMAYAMTIHKSQGSEFENVAICLDNRHSRLLSQELVYTAVTRSKGGLMIVSPEKLLYRAVLQRGNRQTGLALQF